MQIQNTLEFLHWVLFLLEEQSLHIRQPLTYTHTFRACIEFTGHLVHFMPPSGEGYKMVASDRRGRGWKGMSWDSEAA